MSLNYHIQLIRPNGEIVWQSTIPAQEAYFAGHVHYNELHQPNQFILSDLLPFKYRKAYNRHPGFWFDRDDCRAPATLQLYSTRHKPIAKLIATPLWLAS